jgi:hypothetical protein
VQDQEPAAQVREYTSQNCVRQLDASVAADVHASKDRTVHLVSTPKARPNDLSANSNSNFEFATKRVVGPNDLSANFSSQTVLEMGGGL